MLSLDTLEHTLFAPLIGQTFQIEDLDRSYPLVLEEIRELGHRRPEAKRDPFALTFRGEPGLNGPQKIYRLSHPELGTLEIFLTQTANSPEGAEFEVLFN